jgi:endonuclease YncB( thermonuclease family)
VSRVGACLVAQWLLSGGLLVGAAAGAEPQEAVWARAWVSWVMDGDTLLLVPEGQKEAIKVRVDGIDAPETCQPGGEASRDAMIRLAMRKTVELRQFGHDHYGRQVAQVRSGDVDLGAEMVRTGMAWAYRYRVGVGPYAKLQKRAQQDRRGLFGASETAMSPAVFRKFHGSCHAPMN